MKFIEGTIAGLIVQKDASPKISKDDKDPAKTSYTVSYWFTNGKDISAINEQGVHRTSDAVVFAVAMEKGRPPDDDQVAQAFSDMPSGAMGIGYTKNGGQVIRIGGRSKQDTGSNPGLLVGTLTVDRVTNKASVKREIEVETSAGAQHVPISDFVPFSTHNGG